jgi:DNA repair exonuclease SbcCD ATPase subunit
MSESYWWCPNCREEVDGHHVTYQEQHEACGHLVESISITPEKQERIAKLEAELAKARATLGEYLMQDDPLTVGLKADNARLQAELAKAMEAGKASTKCLHEEEQDNARLRECLKRLEWAADGRCPVCGKPKSCGHRFDCWLAAETGGK